MGGQREVQRHPQVCGTHGLDRRGNEQVGHTAWAVCDCQAAGKRRHALVGFFTELPHVGSQHFAKHQSRQAPRRQVHVTPEHSEWTGCVMRFIRFIASVIRLRSLGCASWIDAYDNFKPGHGK